MHEEQLTIESLAYGGDGVAHLKDGRVAFIPATVPGDVIRAEFSALSGKSAFARGQAAEVIESSPQRVAPLCPEAASGACGGCPWAQVAYEEQLRCKRRSVVDALVRIAHLDPLLAEEQLVADIIPAAKQWHYRNKVEFEVGQDVAGRLTLGMHAHGGAFTPLASCMLCPENLAKAPKALTGSLRFACGVEDFGFERVGVRSSERTGDTEVALWTRPGRFPRSKVAKVVSDGFPGKAPGIARVLIKEGSDTAARKIAGVESLTGRGSWCEQVGKFRMRLSAPSFFQVNTVGAEKLVELVLDGLHPGGLDNVVDLYSGAGTFTLPLSEHAMSTIAIEQEGSSVRDLRRNLDRNGLSAEVVGDDVARALPGLGIVDKAVVDPPRSGLSDAALKAIASSGLRRIAYVSCNPTTLARDIAKLSDSYTVSKVTPVDLFPQTYHVECVALLSKRWQPKAD